MREWRPGDPTDPENCPVCGGNPDNCDHPTVRVAPKPRPKPKDIGTAPGQFPGPGLVGVEQSLKQAAEPYNPEHFDMPIGSGGRQR